MVVVARRFEKRFEKGGGVIMCDLLAVMLEVVALVDLLCYPLVRTHELVPAGERVPT